MPRRRRTKPGDGPEVLIIGGGFAGISALEVLGRSRVRVTLVDRNIYSTFQPLLYQVATAGLTAADVAYPLWSATGRRGARFRKGELTALDLGERVAVLASGEKLSYDYLIVATGVSAAFYGVEGAAEHSLSLYTRRDAITLRNQLMAALEKRNEGLTDPELDITVVGGGATGVELAGTLAELRNTALPAVFPEIDRAMLRVRLIEMSPALLAPYHDSLRQYARRQLEERGSTSCWTPRSRRSGPGQCCWPTAASTAATSPCGRRASPGRTRPGAPACPAARDAGSTSAPICG